MAFISRICKVRIYSVENGKVPSPRWKRRHNHAHKLDTERQAVFVRAHEKKWNIAYHRKRLTCPILDRYITGLKAGFLLDVRYNS